MRKKSSMNRCKGSIGCWAKKIAVPEHRRPQDWIALEKLRRSKENESRRASAKILIKNRIAKQKSAPSSLLIRVVKRSWQRFHREIESKIEILKDKTLSKHSEVKIQAKGGRREEEIDDDPDWGIGAE